jgi:hypothetical protein
MKIGSKDHIKVKRLKRALGIPLYQAVGILETLYQVCAQSADDGGIGRYSDADIAIELEWDRDPGELIQALVTSGLVDTCDVNRLAIHDWSDHAPDFIKDRLRKRAEKSSCSRNYGGDSGSSRNSGGCSIETTSNSALTKPSQAKPITTKPNHASGRSRKRNGALASVSPDDLQDPPRLLEWFATCYPNRQSQDGKLFVLAASQAALRGTDPPALFVHIVSRDSRDSVRQSDWDQASKLMQQHRIRGAPPSTERLLEDLQDSVLTTDEP